jgi:myo-inositol-1(or 4)-monophosphatase
MQRRDTLIAALKAAGREILKYDPTKLETSSKSRVGDLLTAADLASEKIIIETILNTYPDDLVIPEETTEGQERLHEDNLPDLTGWVIDPIDGTHNFKHGMAYSGISIGYIENGEPVIGGILDPYRDALYLAVVGQGATCNDQPLHVSDRAVFDTGTRVCTSNSLAKRGTLNNLELLANIDDVWVDVLGSAVLIMADIASGKLDLYYHTWLKPWDNAAGFLITREAGAKIVDLKGQPVSWLTSEAVMGNPKLVDLFIQKTAS